MQENYKKLIDAGFTVLRTGETNAPVIKKWTGNSSWAVMEKFPSRAARDRRINELKKDPKVIVDEFLPRDPYWDEELQGVVIPELRFVLDAKNLDNGRFHNWEEAQELAASAGKRLFTRDEAYILLYYKDKINSILGEHEGDLLDDFFWTSQEPSRAGAWYVNFSSGVVYAYNKFYSYAVRAVAAL